jgi:hypothetical protein
VAADDKVGHTAGSLTAALPHTQRHPTLHPRPGLAVDRRAASLRQTEGTQLHLLQTYQHSLQQHLLNLPRYPPHLPRRGGQSGPSPLPEQRTQSHLNRIPQSRILPGHEFPSVEAAAGARRLVNLLAAASVALKRPLPQYISPHLVKNFIDPKRIDDEGAVFW